MHYFLRKAVNCLSFILTFWQLLLVCIFGISSCAHRETMRLMKYEEYAALSVHPPYVLKLTPKLGALLYFGAEHTEAVDNPQFDQIETLWNNFKPTLALSEGGIWPLEKTRADAIIKHGEQGLLRFLANRDGIVIKSLEPVAEDEVAYLLEQYTQEEITLYYVLRQVAQYRRMKVSQPLAVYISQFLVRLHSVTGLERCPASIEEFTQLYTNIVDQSQDWRYIPAEWFYPTLTETIFNHIARTTNRFRDEHMVRIIAEYVRNGERVFAVVGFSHVVMQEPALKDLLQKWH